MRAATALAAFAILLAACGGGETVDTEAPVAAPLPTVAPTTAPPATDPPPSSTTTEAIEAPSVCEQPAVAGFTRLECGPIVYELSVPDACVDSSCGVIVDIHGRTQTAERANELTGMREVGNAAGYIVIHPESPYAAWVDMPREARLIREFVEEVLDAFGGDRTRVHVGGGSNGGFMTWQFVCDHADLVASAAPLAAGITCPFDEEGAPTEEVDVLVFHGTTDTQVQFGAAEAQRSAAVAFWQMDEQDPIADEDDYRWFRWVSPTGTELQFVAFEWQGPTGGHCVPGTEGHGGCGGDNPVRYAEAALAFYEAHPKDG